jgi:hypothetical protein
MIALLVMAAISRCAVAALCPSNADLASAIYDRGEEATVAWMIAEQARDPSVYPLAHAVLVRRIGDVHCSAAEPGAAASVTCSFTALVGRRTLYEVAQLEHREDKWVIVKDMFVERE